MSSDPRIGTLQLHCLRIPTDAAEADGTLHWQATGMLLVQVEGGGRRGLGYSYCEPRAAAALVADKLAPRIEGMSAFDLPRLWARMNRALRNAGRPGLGLMAIAAVDTALWDLKARLLGVPLASLWGRQRTAVPAYGSGGFTSYDDAQLARQLGGWAEQGFAAVKMKIGSDPARDRQRLRRAREAVGPDVTLMADANGAFTPRPALAMAQSLAEAEVRWYEEPVSSDDLAGLAWLRQRMPPAIAVAAGEYGWDAIYFRAMLEAGAVDVLQADATRCGYTGFLQAATLCEAAQRPLSAHCAPALHAPVCAAAPRLEHLEHFHDHARLESMLFEQTPALDGGALLPLDAPGHGLSLRRDQAARFAL